jgi:hypothetical protein
MEAETTTKGTTTMFAVGSRWRERSGREFVVRGVRFNGAVDVLFDGGWPLTLAASESVKWTAVVTNAELAVAA